jgi:cytochrome c oxidase subunit 3
VSLPERRGRRLPTSCRSSSRLTGLHGAHVFVGLTLLLAATVRAYRGHYSPESHHGVEIPGIYWHFVDVMWIVVYTTVYIL